MDLLGPVTRVKKKKKKKKKLTHSGAWQILADVGAGRGGLRAKHRFRF